MKEVELEKDNLSYIGTVCKVCNREMPEGTIVFRHPKLGTVCEYCPQFKDGGIIPLSNEEVE